MHVIKYKLVRRTEGSAHRKMIAVMEEFGATKMEEIFTLWTVPSHGRTSKMICRELSRLIRKHDVPAKRIHLWVSKYNPHDMKYGKIKRKKK
ncbi:MAG: hypothetical protein OXI74_16590 [Rhodospirillaceae bacterium]|nr:hypothetical protein [Rhodospirillaceae bacterium]